MNKLTIIGNLTRAPELRVTQSGLNVCTFTVAVNRRLHTDGQQEADFFRVTAWRQLGENCQKYLDKGRKVCVIGPVTVSTYTGNDGATRASLEVTAENVEFLSSRADAEAPLAQAARTATAAPEATPPATGWQEIDCDDLPF